MTDAWDGRPQNPERDGWHWLMRADGFAAPYRWTARASGFWLYPPDWELMPEDKAIARQTYLGPCLLPAEVEAERDRLRDALRDCVETWRPLLADADLTAHENPAYLTLMRADLALGEDRA